MKELNILLVDDHQIIIDGLRALVNSVEGMHVIGDANNGKEAIEMLKVLDADVVLMDIDMPVMNGLDATKAIKDQPGKTRVIILSMHCDSGMVKELIGIGADGYLMKNTSKDELIEAITKVASGQQYFAADVTLSLLKENTPSTQSKLAAELTKREREILGLIADGFSNKEIGEKLFISHRTVDTHRSNLMKKLEVNNIAGLVGFAIKNGIST
ncbi:MAG: response regulator transcription factor [Bacteroidales bacterium]|nr:response regulator transcription factor [Bacteroidales bacterium]MCF6341519.1 response regulator transcription factor [Bacteroidales bacterium]